MRADRLDGDDVVQEEQEHLDLQRERQHEGDRQERHAYQHGWEAVRVQEGQAGHRAVTSDRVGALLGPPGYLADRELACIANRCARRRREDSPTIVL